jgi:hypothetical protein
LIASDVTNSSYAVRRRVLCALHVSVVDGIHAGMCLCFDDEVVSWVCVERKLWEELRMVRRKTVCTPKHVWCCFV